MSRRREFRRSALVLTISVAPIVAAVVAENFFRAPEPVFHADRTGLLLAIVDDGGQFGRAGLRLAVWDDGAFVIASDVERSGEAMRCGRLRANTFAALRAFLGSDALAAAPSTTPGGTVHGPYTALSFASVGGFREHWLPIGWPISGDAHRVVGTDPSWSAQEWRQIAGWLRAERTLPYSPPLLGKARLPMAYRPSARDLNPTKRE